MKKKQELDEELEDIAELDEDSDIAVHEKFVKEKKFKRI